MTKEKNGEGGGFDKDKWTSDEFCESGGCYVMAITEKQKTQRRPKKKQKATTLQKAK